MDAAPGAVTSLACCPAPVPMSMASPRLHRQVMKVRDLREDHPQRLANMDSPLRCKRLHAPSSRPLTPSPLGRNAHNQPPHSWFSSS